MTHSATLPRSACATPDRPCVPMATRSVLRRTASLIGVAVARAARHPGVLKWARRGERTEIETALRPAEPHAYSGADGMRSNCIAPGGS